jgi:hypothetical protein
VVEVLLGVALFGVFIVLGIRNRKRRALMTPEARAAEDQLHAIRELTREVRRNRRY